MDKFYLLSEKTLAKAGVIQEENKKQESRARHDLRLPTKREPVEDLQKEIDEINAGQFLTNEEKWLRYAEIFNKYFSIYGKKTVQTQTVHEEEEEPSKSSKLENLIPLVTSYVPKMYSRKADSIVRHVITNSPERWTNSGELIDFNNKVVGNSSILELVDYSVRKRTNKLPPVGWNMFKQLLEEQELPKEFLPPTEKNLRSETTEKNLRRQANVLKKTRLEQKKKKRDSEFSPIRTRQKLWVPFV